MLNVIRILSVVVGSLLLSLNIAGHMVSPVAEDIPGEPVGPNYTARLTSLDNVRSEVAVLKRHELPPEATARQLHTLVSNYFVHKLQGPYQVQPWDNWISWLLGIFDQRYLISQSGDFLLRRGGGQCEQAAIVYTELAQTIGLEAHLAWLGDHVVSETTLPGKGYVLVDADTGVFWDQPLEAFGKELTCDDVRKRFEVEGYSSRLARKIALAYCTEAGNKRSDFPYEPYFFRVERVASFAKWAVPLFLILVSILASYQRGRTAK